MTSVTFPDGTKFSDDGSSANDMRNGGFRTNLLPMVGKTIGVSADAVAAADAAQQSAAAASDDAAATAADRSAVAGDRAISEAARDAAVGYAVQAQQWIGSASNVVIAALSKQIAATTTLVDCFVYDTRLDTDGGAWIDKCGWTSWENESLNTATRGPRRKFPVVALIVAEQAKLTIYDALDLDANGAPRMWMVFNANGMNGTSTALSRYITSAVAIDGWLVLGNSGNGVTLIHFPTETSGQVRSADLTPYGTPIAGRNATYLAGASSRIGHVTGNIISNTVNSVHARALSGAPLDAAGLAVPTVAVATAAGVSVIRHDGTVYDLTSAAGHDQVKFLDDSRLMTRLGSDKRVEVGLIPSADAASNAWRSFVYASNVSPAILGGSATAINRNAIASPQGLTLLAEDTSNPANGMVAYLTATYCTGWMPGNTVGAWLNGSETGAITGSGELVANGTFPTDTSGWTAINGGAIAVSGGEIAVTAPAGTYGSAGQTISGLVVGQTYVVTASARKGTAGSARLMVQAGAVGGTTLVDVNTTSATSAPLTGSFTATPTSVGISLLTMDGGTTAYFDNISVRLATPDRSYKAKGLIVNGTLQRNAANGGDVVVWSGFSTSNYLEQPYNADLDFGTGDFWFRWSGKITSTPTQCTLVSRDSATTGARFQLYLNAAGLPRFFVSDGTNSANAAGTSSLADGNTHIIECEKRGSTLELWVDGVLTATASAASVGSLSNAVATLRIGIDQQGANPATNAAACMVRISAYAPTAAQIAKMYADERGLFDSGAKAFLGGTSSSVQALSYDDATGKLAVGTGDGVSVFAGLRRVDYKDAAGVAVGANLVTNPGGPFTNTTGWAGSSASLAVTNGELIVTATSASAWPRAVFALSGLTAGKSYLVTAKARRISTTTGVQAYVRNSANYSSLISAAAQSNYTTSTTTVELTATLVAQSGVSHQLSIESAGVSEALGASFAITSVSVVELGAISNDNIKAVCLRNDTLLIGTAAEAGIVAPQINGREAIVAPRVQAVAVQSVAAASGGNFDFAMLMAIGGGINIPYLGK
ncbi:LamG domain-containing protein [Azospirillum sp. A1-3]|uniref:LamG domain-containing protein n=1 Tax=Azospirillum sp. A1-3 TaxID=185874 RepID=UPI002076E74F|nr:LamG domain-containing protein [Azospirillum sp. A1-3]MCM8736016.1 LamG domain-containing protein [Azospirillum sp. A1-3]